MDWVGLVSTAVAAPLGILARLSQAGVDQYTIEISKALGSQFSIPTSYLSIIEKKLASTQKFGISSDFLFFGTGISIIPRLLSSTRGGVTFAALILALWTIFDGDYTSQVVFELLKSMGPEEVFLPFGI